MTADALQKFPGTNAWHVRALEANPKLNFGHLVIFWGMASYFFLYSDKTIIMQFCRPEVLLRTVSWRNSWPKNINSVIIYTPSKLMFCSCFEEWSNSVFTVKRFVDLGNSPDFPSGWGRVGNDWICIFVFLYRKRQCFIIREYKILAEDQRAHQNFLHVDHMWISHPGSAQTRAVSHSETYWSVF